MFILLRADTPEFSGHLHARPFADPLRSRGFGQLVKVDFGIRFPTQVPLPFRNTASSATQFQKYFSHKRSVSGAERPEPGLESRGWWLLIIFEWRCRDFFVTQRTSGGQDRSGEWLAQFAPPRPGGRGRAKQTRGRKNPGSGSYAGSKLNDGSHHASPLEGSTSWRERAQRRGAAAPRGLRGRAAPYLRPRGWRCQRWCAPPACAWKSPGSGSDREPVPKPWPAAGDGDWRKTRRRPVAWSLQLGAPSEAGLSCSSWTKERAALQVLGCRPAVAPWPPPPAPLCATRARFPRCGRRGQSQGARLLLNPSEPRGPRLLRRAQALGSVRRRKVSGQTETWGCR